MPYYITESNPDCNGWAVVDATDGYYGCHTTKQSAIDQAVAISISTDEPFVGERAANGELNIGDYVTWGEESETLGEIEVIAEPVAAVRIYEKEDGIYSETDKLVIMNILQLKRVPRPEMVAEKESDETLESDDEQQGNLPENYRPALAEDVPEGRACGNCLFFNESRINQNGDKAWCEKWDAFVDGGNYCNAWQADEEKRAGPDELAVGDFVSWNSSGGRARGRILRIVRDGRINIPDSSFTITGTEDNPAALIALYRASENGYEETDTRVGHRFSTLRKIDSLETESRAVNLSAPAFMRAAARRGLALYEQGRGGDGLVSATIREARAMAAGNVTADKWVRIAAWIARHMPDLDAPQNSNTSDPDYPGPGLVAHLLWGSGPSKRRAQRTMEYAQRVVDRLEAEGERGKKMLVKEERTTGVNFEVRESSNGMTYSGYAAIWDSPSEPLPFIERIQRGAFRKTLQSRNEIKLLWNHDAGQVLGSLRAGTLRLFEDAKGLRVEADLPDTQLGRDTAVLLKRGDISSMSFGFSVPKGGDTWNEDGTERTLKSVRLFEVSIVAWPAYTATMGTATVRSFDKLALRSQLDEDTLSDVMLKLEEGQDLTPEEAALISEAVDALTAKSDEPAAVEQTIEEIETNLLELKRKQLELIKKKVF